MFGALMVTATPLARPLPPVPLVIAPMPSSGARSAWLALLTARETPALGLTVPPPVHAVVLPVPLVSVPLVNMAEKLRMPLLSSTWLATAELGTMPRLPSREMRTVAPPVMRVEPVKVPVPLRFRKPAPFTVSVPALEAPMTLLIGRCELAVKADVFVLMVAPLAPIWTFSSLGA